MPPEIIAGRYRVEREVGRGGMGSVWLCRDELLGRLVAVKQVGHPPGESAPDLARAMREARSSAPLNHPNVVSIYDAIDEGDHIWLVMEYVPGRTLAQLVAQEGRLPPERAARIGAQVADGLAAAHSRGTVHRDVKPGNILVTDADSAKISDFGISRTTGDPTLTQAGLVSGTPAYFSPQLARGEDPTPADDVWALGATLYAAVEGRQPYPEQRNAIAMLSQIVSDTPPAPEHAGFLDECIRRMLDPDPASRWSMADAAHALRRMHEQHDTSGTREATRVAQPAARPAAAAAPAADPTPTPTSTFEHSPAAGSADAPPAPPASTPAERSPRRRGGLIALGVLLLAACVLGGYLLLGNDQGDADPQASPGRSASGSPSPSDGATSQEPAEDPSDDGSTPEQEPTAEESADEPSSQPAGQGSRASFVEGYYGLLPDDTESGWAQLSPEYQSQTSFGEYDGFWSTVDDVTVEQSRPAGPDAVDVTLTYNKGTQREVRRIFLERGEDGYLITDDQILG
ncbi:MAG: serine/threonine-protein kinase [Aeromicrobium sp.]